MEVIKFSEDEELISINKSANSKHTTETSPFGEQVTIHELSNSPAEFTE
jgi:hypothetical protein